MTNPAQPDPAAQQPTVADLVAMLEKAAAHKPVFGPHPAPQPAEGFGAIVCYSTCWACKFGECYDPPAEHRWADADDIAYAKESGKPEPTGNCACPCARPVGGAQ